VQTTLLGLAIAFIIALVAALVGPYFIDWNQFRPQFEAEASQVIGARVRVMGALDARLLPTPTLRLRSVVVGGPNDLGKVGADKLDVEFSLGDLMRGQWRANELTIEGMALDLGLDPQGRIDWLASSGRFNLGSLSIDRLNLTGRIALHDAASHTTVEMSDIAFSGDVRSLAGSVRGDGSFTSGGTRYPFRVSSGQLADGGGTRVHLNIDPGERVLSAELDGVLSFEARAPRFEGAVALAVPASPKPKAGETALTPWRVSAKVKADHAVARLEQIEGSYGTEERALKFAGLGDIRFGASPLLHADLSARQLDADRLIAKDAAKETAKEAAKENSKGNPKDNSKDNSKDILDDNSKGNSKDTGAEPVRLLPALRTLMTAVPHPPFAARIEFSAEQITLGGRPLQNLVADLHGDAAAWSIDRLDLRAPGGTQIAFSGAAAQSGNAKGTLNIDSSDPDVLIAWLQGRGDVGYRSQKPLRLHGNVEVAPDHVSIDALKAEIDGGAVEGRVALASAAAGGGSRFDAVLKADRLDLDAAAAFTRSLAGPAADWPDQATVSLDIGRAISAGQELRPFAAKFGYTPKTFSLDRLNFGQAGGVTMDGAGSFDRADATGKLTLTAGAASLAQITALVAPFAPALTARLDAMGTPPGPARLKLALDTAKNAEAADRASARVVLDLDAPQLKGVISVTAKPQVSAIRAGDLEAIGRSELSIESKLLAERGDSLLVLLGLDHAVSAGDGAVQFEASVSGVFGAPLRLNARMWGGSLDAEAQGTAEPWAQTPTASVNLRVRSVNLAPVFGLKPSDRAAQNVRVFTHVSLAGNKLSFDDLDSVAGGSRLRGHLALTLDQPREVDGEIGLDALDLAPALALAIGAAGHDPAEPLGAGLMKGWRGRVAFQALSGALPGGVELRPVGGTMKSDGQSLTIDAIKGKIGGGDVTANIDTRQEANGVALNARLELANVDGAALHYRGLKMPAGRTSLQMTLASQGRSVSALTGALSGSGTATLAAASIVGLDPRAFEVAIRASDTGQATDDARLRQIVEPVLSAGALPVASAQIPFTIRDGRLRVDATTLDSDGGRAIVSGGYDIPADQADIRATLTSTAVGSDSSRPEIQLFAAGSPDTLKSNVDVGSLSSWLAVRAIDRETRRLDSIERGEPPQALPASIPPSTSALPLPALPGAAPLEQTPLDVPGQGRDPRRFLPRPKTIVAPTVAPLAPRPLAVAPVPAPPIVSQQAAPLPPAIEVRPAPGPAPVPVKPKPRPPILLTPPGTIP
jgi:AsmA-like C-terminal region/AsmA family